jgi:OOP family OmpA-OmpF porin
MFDKVTLTPLNTELKIPAIQGPRSLLEQNILDVRTETAPNSALSTTAQVGDTDLQKLRELLFLREMELLRKLEKRLDDPIQHARETSEVIAEALLLRSQQKDSMLYTAFEPMSERLLKDALRKNPMDFVNVLFPLMGPAIRRSIAETFHSMLEGFHKTMEQVFSWKGMRWRLQAMRTGISFSQVVLLHTLLYRVEQIFFIHAETGLVLSHVYNEGAVTQDAEMVSAMLTAIQDFARDCFTGKQESSLDSLQMGEFTIMVERGSSAYLACVVRGSVPLEFKEKLRDTMITLQLKFADELDSFKGDTEKFLPARWDLENLLDARYADEDAPLPFWVKLMPVMLVLLLVLGGGYWWRDAQQQSIARKEAKKHMEASLAQVGKNAGILLVEARQDAPEHWEVIYLKDQFAEDPQSLLDAKGIDPKTYSLRVIPHVSYEADMLTKRVKERITPPESVSMSFDKDGTLHLRGEASMSWILQARQEALALPGVEKIDMSRLTDPRVDELKRMIALVETTVVGFPSGKDVPVPEDAAKLAKAINTLVDIEKLAGSMNVTVNLTIYGHADATGSSKFNYEISQARARTIAAMLYNRGSAIPIATYGMGSEHASQEPSGYTGNQTSRKVELRVHLAQLPSDTVLNILH